MDSWLTFGTKTLLGIEELEMHIEHLKLTAERRKEGAKKAALTRKATEPRNKARKQGNQQLKVSTLAINCIGRKVFDPIDAR